MSPSPRPQSLPHIVQAVQKEERAVAKHCVELLDRCALRKTKLSAAGDVPLHVVQVCTERVNVGKQEQNQTRSTHDFHEDTRTAPKNGEYSHGQLKAEESENQVIGE